MNRHILKTDTDVFDLSWNEEKLYEIRLDDRNFKVGDELLLVETFYTGEEMKAGKPLEYTGKLICVTVTHKLKGVYGLKDNWCILGCFHEYVDTAFDVKDSEDWLAGVFVS